MAKELHTGHMTSRDVLAIGTQRVTEEHWRKKAASVEPLLQSTAPGKLKTTDDSASLQWIIRLASSTAARTAGAFLEFLQQGHLISRSAAMSSGPLIPPEEFYASSLRGL